jgi:hypothetical protein
MNSRCRRQILILPLLVRLGRIAQSEPVVLKRLASIPVLGTGAIMATITDPSAFRSDHDFAAWIGLVPPGWRPESSPIAVISQLEIPRNHSSYRAVIPFFASSLADAARVR